MSKISWLTVGTWKSRVCSVRVLCSHRFSQSSSPPQVEFHWFKEQVWKVAHVPGPALEPEEVKTTYCPFCGNIVSSQEWWDLVNRFQDKAINIVLQMWTESWGVLTSMVDKQDWWAWLTAWEGLKECASEGRCLSVRVWVQSLYDFDKSHSKTTSHPFHLACDFFY